MPDKALSTELRHMLESPEWQELHSPQPQFPESLLAEALESNSGDDNEDEIAFQEEQQWRAVLSPEFQSDMLAAPALSIKLKRLKEELAVLLSIPSPQANADLSTSVMQHGLEKVAAAAKTCVDDFRILDEIATKTAQIRHQYRETKKALDALGIDHRSVEDDNQTR